MTSNEFSNDKEKYPKVSIIVLNYNGKHHLKTCLESLLRTRYPNFEIVFVDNESTDGSVEYVQQNYPTVKIVRLSKNIYAAGGFMAGALVAKGKYISLIANDMAVDENWLAPLVEILEKMPWIAAADAKYKNFYLRNMFDDAAASGRWIDYFGNNYTRGAREVDYGQYDKMNYVFCATAIIRRDILLKIGGFDTSLLFGYEDIDMCWRLYLAGYKAVYVPQSIIYHKGGGTSREKEGISRAKPEFYYLIKRNRLIMLIKNYEVCNMLVVLFVTIIEYLLTGVYFFLNKQNVYGVQVFRALLYPLKNLRKIMRKRAFVQNLRIRRDKEIRRYMVPYCGDVWKVLKMIVERYIS
jgi:GT2 family glycosyltransferase